MRLITTIVLALVFAGNVASAQTITTYANLESGYSFPEFGFTQYDDWVLQGGATASWENGVFVDLWGSHALDGNIQGDEVDYTIGWGGACGSFSCTASVSFFDIPTPDIFDYSSTDITRFRAQVEGKFNGRLGFMLGVDELTGLVESTLPRVRITYSQPLTAEWSLNGHVGATYNSQPDDTSFYWQAGVSRKFQKWNLDIYGKGYRDPVRKTHHSFVGMGVSKTW